MSSDNDNVQRIGGSYIKLRIMEKYAKWKRKPEALTIQQGYKQFIIGQI